MERLFGFTPGKNRRTEAALAAEALDQERKLWKSALLGINGFGDREYAVSLALQGDPSKRIYAGLDAGALGVRIDIPLVEHTPPDKLVSEAYLNATFLGEVDPKKYRKFATDPYIKDHLFAFLNRNSAGVPAEEVSKWFYTTFKVEHVGKYGSVFIGSYGGRGQYGYDFNATIEPLNRGLDRFEMHETEEVSIGKANDFSTLVRKSLPHLDIAPLVVDAYLQDLQTNLKFLPRDWE